MGLRDIIKKITSKSDDWKKDSTTPYSGYTGGANLIVRRNAPPPPTYGYGYTPPPPPVYNPPPPPVYNPAPPPPPPPAPEPEPEPTPEPAPPSTTDFASDIWDIADSNAKKNKKGLETIDPASKDFNIEDTELFKAGETAAKKQLEGDVSDFDTQANLERERLKTAQAQRAKAVREGLLGQGFADTGKYVKEGILETEGQEFRESQDLERKLIADRAAERRSEIAAGQTATTGLLGLLEKQEAQKRDIGATENLTLLEDKLLTGQKITDAEIDQAQTLFDAEIQEARDNNEFERAKELQERQFDFTLQTKTMDMAHDEKMAWLDTEYQKQLDDNNTENALKIKEFEHESAIEEMGIEAGYNEEMAYLNSELDIAFADNDHVNAMALTRMKIAADLKKHYSAMRLENRKQDLAEAGFAMDVIETEYNRILGEIEAGRANPDAAVLYLKETLGEEGMAVLNSEDYAVDPNAMEKALLDQNKTAELQYAITYGDQDGDGKLDAANYRIEIDPETGEEIRVFDGLNTEFSKDYHSHLMDTYFSQEGTPVQADIVSLKTGDMPIDQITDSHIDYLLNDDVSVPKLDYHQFDYDTNAYVTTDDDIVSAKDWKTTDKDEGKNRSAFDFLERSKFVDIGGNLVYVSGWERDKKGGRDHTIYTLIDVETGNSTTVTAGKDWEDRKHNDKNISEMFKDKGLTEAEEE